MVDKERSQRFVRSARPDRYSYFGATLAELLKSRGYTQSSFARECQRLGYGVRQPRISAWCRLSLDEEGEILEKRTVDICPPWFPPVAENVLGLDDEEWVRLGIAYTYGQTVPRDRRLRSAPMEEVEERRETAPAEISEEGLKQIAEARRYYSYAIQEERGSEERGAGWETQESEERSSGSSEHTSSTSRRR